MGSAFLTSLQKVRASSARKSLFQKTCRKISTTSRGTRPAFSRSVVLGSDGWRVALLGMTTRTSAGVRKNFGCSRSLLDYSGCFYGLSHCEGLFPGSLHVVNVPCMKLDMLDDLVFSAGANHKAAVTVDLFHQKTSPWAGGMFLIN